MNGSIGIGRCSVNGVVGDAVRLFVRDGVNDERRSLMCLFGGGRVEF